MKYVVFKRKDREFPVLFPDILVHSMVAESLTAKHGPLHGWQPVSAGFLSSLNVPAECHGSSETLKLKSRGDADSKLIATVDYTHGVVL